MNSQDNTRETIDTFGKAIYTAIENQGLEILENLNRVKGYLIDTCPEFKQEIYIFSKTFNKEYLKIYKDAFLQDEIRTKQTLAKLRYYFSEKEGIATHWVDILYTNCYEAILYYKRGNNSKVIRNNKNQLNNVYLQKGQKVYLDQSIKRAFIGIGYYTNELEKVHNFEIDIVAFLLDAKGKCIKEEDFIFYNNLKGRNEAVIHQGNSLTNSQNINDQIIKIDFQKIPLDVQRIAICASIDNAQKRKQNFSQISNIYVKLSKDIDNKELTELLNFDIKERFSIESSLVLCEIYKYQGNWKFNAIAAGFQGDLVALLNNYGLEV